ncbi:MULTISPECIES: ABC transporter ATP-binding protein [Haloarcula]|nr:MULTISPECIES: sn-glycerol-3-phosphate ABC transporter ATP-binding protein UgpC [Haloarcula]AJF27829.1 sugar ABC transporter ATP-binding protein [Haloarcula sp. CBA1115]KAA9405078.1 sn-glycerol-3-phosphate ABC transporter ATP-binding protein UgpC [Haloarcula hispanica]KZX46690.1 sugar ABC transporter ATP-binding protein [Haloarcula sp. K1]MUV48330.1 sn-glycerol-3-phosphate ABC transporter ATP-binding protein UgpC [Haloarcula sp. CBA1122]
MSEVTLSNVSKVYDDNVLAVEDLSLAVEDGEFVVVVGPSGCGKSTTLRMIAGLETVTDGEIAIGGDVVNDVRPQDRNIAMVFQSYALYPHMTVRDNMSFGLRLSGEYDDQIEQRVTEAAELLEISDLMDDLPKQLSGGQQQRVALGRAIVRDPEVFLMDEPLSNLDAKLRTQMRTEIQRIQEELDVTTIYVTHDQTEAMTMADRIVILNQGELQQVAPPERCYDEPNNKFVAGFIGSPSMNFFEVSVTNSGGRTAVHSAGVEFTLNVDIPDGEYTLGVRPEDFVAEDAGSYIDTVVDVVEPMGSDNFLYLETADGSKEVVARVDSEYRPERGDEIALGFHTEDMHLFGPDGERVELNQLQRTESA